MSIHSVLLIKILVDPFRVSDLFLTKPDVRKLTFITVGKYFVIGTDRFFLAEPEMVICIRVNFISYGSRQSSYCKIQYFDIYVFQHRSQEKYLILQD